MPCVHTIDPKLEIRERCRALKRLENALNRPDVLARMQYLDANRTSCRFETIEGAEIEALSAEDKARLVDALPLVHRSVDRLRGELRGDAWRSPVGYIYCNYWMPRRTYNSKKVVRKNAKAGGRQRESEPMEYRKFFDTFDEGSSVWTLPSNWKKKDPYL